MSPETNINTTEQSCIKVGGLGRAALDYIITVPTEVAQEVLLRYRFYPSGVQFIEDKGVLLRVGRELEKYGQSILAPGDPVSNTLHTIGICQESRAAPLSLHWFGIAGPQDHEFKYSTDPADSLRRVSVIPYHIASERQDNLAICIVSKETKQVIAILAPGHQEVFINLDDLPSMDVFVVLMHDLLSANEALLKYIRRSEALALIVGDSVNVDESSFKLLTELAAAGKLKWILGRFEELTRLSLLESSTVHPAFQGVEVIGTQGSSPVIIWEPLQRQFVSLDVPGEVVVKGNELGAGDAYAGGYLYSRILSHPVDRSHLVAAACAKRVLEVNTARVEPENDLNVVFGHQIDRASRSHVEGHLYDRIRIAPGVTLVSCGQTGVDQIGIYAATQLGLPSFCLLPQGRRTEVSEGLFQGVDDFGDSYIKELESDSYRYRTWTTAFLADGTLIWDFYGGEGCAATRDACRALGRPFLDLASFDANYILTTVGPWVDRHGIRVINIAGSSGSRLTSEQRAHVESQTFHLLKFLAYRRAQSRHLANESIVGESRLGGTGTDEGPGSVNTEPHNSLRIGVSNAASQRALFEKFLGEVFGLLPFDSRQLVGRWENPALEVIFARPRDLPAMLQEGAIDLALCGSDLLHEAQFAAAVLLETGLSPCFVVLVGKDDKHEVENNGTALRVGSQYPSLASRLLSSTKPEASVRAIHGTAEAWINAGLVDAAIDTWGTGATADANNLHLHQIILETSLVLASLPAETGVYDERIRSFVNKLGVWLAEVST